MYNSKDLQFVGKHDYDKNRLILAGRTFSVNIFQWQMKKTSTLEMKRSKCVVRVKGLTNDKENVLAKVEELIQILDAGKWKGKLSLTIKTKE